MDVPSACVGGCARTRASGCQALDSPPRREHRHQGLLGVLADSLGWLVVDGGGTDSAQLRAVQHPHQLCECCGWRPVAGMAHRQPHHRLRAQADPRRDLGRADRAGGGRAGPELSRVRAGGCRDQALASERGCGLGRDSRIPHDRRGAQRADRQRRLSPPHRAELGRRGRQRRQLARVLPLHDRRRGDGLRRVNGPPRRSLRLLVVVFTEDDRHAPRARGLYEHLRLRAQRDAAQRAPQHLLRGPHGRGHAVHHARPRELCLGSESDRRHPGRRHRQRRARRHEAPL